MGPAALPVVLFSLLVVLSGRTVYAANKDLVRARASGELARRSLPFVALVLMALSLLLVRGFEQGWVMPAWLAVSAVAVILANLFSVPMNERRASRAFRRGDYGKAAGLYRNLADEKPLARNLAFLGAALGAGGEDDGSVKASTRAVEEDPHYGLAYYNRALVLRRTGRKSRAAKDLKRALDADLPRRFRGAVQELLEEPGR